MAVGYVIIIRSRPRRLLILISGLLAVVVLETLLLSICFTNRCQDQTIDVSRRTLTLHKRIMRENIGRHKQRGNIENVSRTFEKFSFNFPMQIERIEKPEGVDTSKLADAKYASMLQNRHIMKLNSFFSGVAWKPRNMSQPISSKDLDGSFVQSGSRKNKSHDTRNRVRSSSRDTDMFQSPDNTNSKVRDSFDRIHEAGVILSGLHGQRQEVPSEKEIEVTHPSEREEDYGQVLDPLPDVCNGYAPYLIILVETLAHERSRRDKIRSTWGSVARHSHPHKRGPRVKSWPRHVPPTGEIRVLFVIGHNFTTSRTGFEEAVVKEQAKNNDMLLVSKPMLAKDKRCAVMNTQVTLTFVMNCCPGTNYVLMLATDTNINIPRLLQQLHILDKRESGFSDTAGDMEIKTDAFLNIFREKNVESARIRYPRFEFSQQRPAGYVISGEAIPGLLQALSRAWQKFPNLDEVMDIYSRLSQSVPGIWRVGLSMANINSRFATV